MEESVVKADMGDKPHSSGGGLSKLTAEQLLEYVKKQNVKMKKLKIENDALHKNVSDLKVNIIELKKAEPINTSCDPVESSQLDNWSSYNLFWDLIDRRPDWQQALARIALKFLCQSLSKLNPAVGSSFSLRHAFSKWVTMSNLVKVNTLQTSLEECRHTNAHLEQRYVHTTAISYE